MNILDDYLITVFTTFAVGWVGGWVVGGVGGWVGGWLENWRVMLISAFN